MSLWWHELRLFLRQNLAIPALLVMALLSAMSIWAGVAEIQRQHAVIERIQPLQAADVAAIAKWVAVEGDAGSAAYYTFHATWDSPSTIAFAAIGQRDVSPFIQRVRALGLEAQLYESENFNAELALPGRFDWVFVLVYLVPLFVIILLHDLKSGEREAGRMDQISAIVRNERLFWIRRIGVRIGLLLAAILLPFLVGASFSNTGLGSAATFALAATAYVLIWVVICVGIGRKTQSSATNAAALAATWLVLTLILPALSHLAINTAIPVRQGVELTLEQREKIHGGWDQPRDTTMTAFAKEHPEWRNADLQDGQFSWKWYFAFQHLGDVAAAPRAEAYREGLIARDAWATRVGYILPAVGLQVLLHRLAETDLRASLVYQSRIRNFHAELRRYYYAYIFNETPFREIDFSSAPRWETQARPSDQTRKSTSPGT